MTAHAKILTGFLTAISMERHMLPWLVDRVRGIVSNVPLISPANQRYCTVLGHHHASTFGERGDEAENIIPARRSNHHPVVHIRTLSAFRVYVQNRFSVPHPEQGISLVATNSMDPMNEDAWIEQRGEIGRFTGRVAGA